MSYKIGDTVLYGGEGICRISGIEDRKISDKTFSYYTLTPINDPNSVFYVPVGSAAAENKLRQIISAQEIIEIVNSAKPTEWVESDRERKEIYRAAISAVDRSALASLIKSVCERKKYLDTIGKKLHKADEYFLIDAEKLLYGEFTTVLKLERSQLIPFILGEIEVSEK